MIPTYKNKVVFVAYSHDTNPQVSEQYVSETFCKKFNHCGYYKVLGDWELGEGEPGIGIPNEIGEDDFRVQEAKEYMLNSLEYDYRTIDNYCGVIHEADNWVIIYVAEDAESLYPEIMEGLY